MGARVYVPSLGRFLQVDPVEGGNLNDYIYPNDPVNSTDYSGKVAFMAVVGVAFLVLEVIDWIDTASEANNCVNGVSESCINAGASAGLALIPGPSLKWLKRGGDAVSSIKPISKFLAKDIPKYASIPSNLTEQLVMKEAIGKGVPILGFSTNKKLSDPRIFNSVWTKKEYVRIASGTQYTVHYLQNRFIPMSKQIKFSDARSIPIK